MTSGTGRSLGAYEDFNAAARAACSLLRHEIKFDVWMASRLVGDNLVIVAADSEAAGVREGDSFPFSETLCSRMVTGDGPRSAPDTTHVPAYANCLYGRGLPALAYMGVPLFHSDGSVAGTLAGVASSAQPKTVTESLPRVEAMARLLSTILATEERANEELHRARKAEEESLVDGLTGISNRRAWDQMLEVEEQRCKRSGTPASVIIADVDRLKGINDTEGHAAGDALLRHVATTLRRTSREPDIVARTGGDEFAVLAVNCGREDALVLTDRLRAALEKEGIAASIGTATRTPSGGLSRTVEEADAAMLAVKRGDVSGRG